jgi:FtsP/CotA-like multicopper oxidase with cupredoxin domain
MSDWGPFLKAYQGDLLQVRFQNQLPVPSTIHWHRIWTHNPKVAGSNLAPTNKTFLC